MTHAFMLLRPRIAPKKIIHAKSYIKIFCSPILGGTVWLFKHVNSDFIIRIIDLFDWEFTLNNIDTNEQVCFLIQHTAWKVFKYGVISGPYFAVFGPEITLYLDTFHAVTMNIITTFVPNETITWDDKLSLWTIIFWSFSKTWHSSTNQ